MNANFVWACLPSLFASFEALALPPDDYSLKAETWREYCQTMADEEYGPVFDRATGILVQPVRGMLLRGADAEMETFYECMDSSRIDAAARFAENNPQVQALVFLMDSGGGYTAGMKATIAALESLQTARPELPVLSFVEGYCCSLAYLFANAAGPIYCAESAEIGSIGVMAVTEDSSGLYKNAGLERRLFSDGDYKGMGSSGVPWKKAWYEMVQKGIDETSAYIRAAIIAKRPGVTLADMQGQHWEVAEAPAALHDGIQDGGIEEFMVRLADALSAPAV